MPVKVIAQDPKTCPNCKLEVAKGNMPRNYECPYCAQEFCAGCFEVNCDNNYNGRTIKCPHCQEVLCLDYQGMVQMTGEKKCYS